MVSRLQAKASQIGSILTSLEKKYDKTCLSTHNEEEGETDKLKKSSSTSQIVGERNDGHKKRYSMRIDPIPPFNPNKHRKSDAFASPQTTENLFASPAVAKAAAAKAAANAAAANADASTIAAMATIAAVASATKNDTENSKPEVEKKVSPEQMGIETETDEMVTDNQ